MMQVILHCYDRCVNLVSAQIPITQIIGLGLFDLLVKMKYDVPNNKLEILDDYMQQIDEKTAALAR